MDINIGNNAFEQQENYTKQPTGQPKPLSASTDVVTIVAKAVTASKHENNELIQVGKFGFALAGNVKLNYYQLLLYSNKTTVLFNLVITKDFKYEVCENKTVEFLSKDNWHIEFVNINDAVGFNSHLSFVLWKLNGCKELFWNDLYYPPRDDKVATVGSIVEIAYVAHTIEGKMCGPEVSNNIGDDRFLKVKVCEIGWERSLLGVNENTRRIIFIPVAEMGAWKILTDGRQCLCLTVTVQSVCKDKKDGISDSQAITIQEPLNTSYTNDNSTHNQSEEIVHDVSVTPLEKIDIESLFEEFEKLKSDNFKTKERLTKLEALIQEKSAEVGNSKKFNFHKLLKNTYKCIAKEFPVDKTFSGEEIQLKIRSIFYEAL